MADTDRDLGLALTNAVLLRRNSAVRSQLVALDARVEGLEAAPPGGGIVTAGGIIFAAATLTHVTIVELRRHF